MEDWRETPGNIHRVDYGGARNTIDGGIPDIPAKQATVNFRGRSVTRHPFYDIEPLRTTISRTVNGRRDVTRDTRPPVPGMRNTDGWQEDADADAGRLDGHRSIPGRVNSERRGFGTPCNCG